MAIFCLGCLASFMIVVGVFGPPASAQMRDSSNWIPIAIQVAKNESRISHMEAFITRLEDAKLPDRIIKIESQVDWLGVLLKAIIGFQGLILAEIALRAFKEKR